MTNQPIQPHPDRKPTHPGEILREDVLPELKISQAALARKLGLSPRTFSNIIHERRSINSEIAIALEAHCGSNAEQWMRLQMAHDLWVARRSGYQS